MAYDPQIRMASCPRCHDVVMNNGQPIAGTMNVLMPVPLNEQAEVQMSMEGRLICPTCQPNLDVGTIILKRF